MNEVSEVVEYSRNRELRLGDFSLIILLFEKRGFGNVVWGTWTWPEPLSNSSLFSNRNLMSQHNRQNFYLAPTKSCLLLLIFYDTWASLNGTVASWNVILAFPEQCCGVYRAVVHIRYAIHKRITRSNKCNFVGLRLYAVYIAHIHRCRYSVVSGAGSLLRTKASVRHPFMCVSKLLYTVDKISAEPCGDSDSW